MSGSSLTLVPGQYSPGDLLGVGGLFCRSVELCLLVTYPFLPLCLMNSSRFGVPEAPISSLQLEETTTPIWFPASYMAGGNST